MLMSVLKQPQQTNYNFHGKPILMFNVVAFRLIFGLYNSLQNSHR